MIRSLMLGSTLAMGTFWGGPELPVSRLPGVPMSNVEAASGVSPLPTDCPAGCHPYQPTIWIANPLPCFGEVFVEIAVDEQLPSETISKCTSSSPCIELYPCQFSVVAEWGWSAGAGGCADCQRIIWFVDGFGPFILSPPGESEALEAMLSRSCGAAGELAIYCVNDEGFNPAIGRFVIGCAACPQPIE